MKKIEVSYKTIVFTFLLLILFWFLYIVRDVIMGFFVALLIMAILNPTVTKLSKRKIPRGVSILTVYLLLLGLVGFTIAAVVPPLVEQSSSFINNLPRFMSHLGISASVNNQITQQFVSLVGILPAEAAKLTVSLFGNILSVITVFVIAFYLLAEREDLNRQLGAFLGDEKNKKLGNIIDTLERHLGSWARGQGALMLAIGIANYVGLRLLGLPFALPLSILAGLLEIVPYIGPVLAAIPAVIIGFGISPVLGIATIALTFLIQQLENYIFVPKIIQKSTGVDPIVTLLSLAIGFRLAGMIGLLISVPVFITARLLTHEYLLSKS
jgi:predicted PurR-regulated permease PerM